MDDWRAVADWPEYEVSRFGDIRRSIPDFILNPKNGVRYIRYPAGRLLCPTLDKDGYRYVTLARRGLKVRGRIAALVCAAFHGPRPSPLHECAHGDGKNTNDCADNLRWATHLENCADAILHGTSLRGSRNGHAILSEEQVREIRHQLQTAKISPKQMAVDYGVSRSAIEAIKYRRNWKHI